MWQTQRDIEIVAPPFRGDGLIEMRRRPEIMIANIQRLVVDSKSLGTALIAALALSGTSTAWADPTMRHAPLGVYLGVSGGFSPSHRVCQGLPTAECDHLSFGHKVYGGWDMTNDVALEVGYLYFNGIDRNYRDTPNGNIYRERVTDRAWTLGFDWHVDLLNSITNHLRVGVARAQRTTQTSYLSGPAHNFEDYKTVPYVGAGLGVAVNEVVHLNMGFDYIFNNAASRHLLTVGVTTDF